MLPATPSSILKDFSPDNAFKNSATNIQSLTWDRCRSSLWILIAAKWQLQPSVKFATHPLLQRWICGSCFSTYELLYSLGNVRMLAVKSGWWTSTMLADGLVETHKKKSMILTHPLFFFFFRAEAPDFMNRLLTRCLPGTKISKYHRLCRSCLVSP